MTDDSQVANRNLVVESTRLWEQGHQLQMFNNYIHQQSYWLFFISIIEHTRHSLSSKHYNIDWKY